MLLLWPWKFCFVNDPKAWPAPPYLLAEDLIEFARPKFAFYWLALTKPPAVTTFWGLRLYFCISNWLFMTSWWSIVSSNCSRAPCLMKVELLRLFIVGICPLLAFYESRFPPECAYSCAATSSSWFALNIRLWLKSDERVASKSSSQSSISFVFLPSAWANRDSFHVKKR